MPNSLVKHFEIAAAGGTTMTVDVADEGARSDISDLDTRLTTAEGNITSLGTRATSLERTATASVTTTWTANSSRYYQDVTVTGMTSTATPTMGLYFASAPSAADGVAMAEAFSLVTCAIPSNGSVRLWCCGDKPTKAFTVIFKGF